MVTYSPDKVFYLESPNFVYTIFTVIIYYYIEIHKLFKINVTTCFISWVHGQWHKRIHIMDILNKMHRNQNLIATDHRLPVTWIM